MWRERAGAKGGGPKAIPTISQVRDMPVISPRWPLP